MANTIQLRRSATANAVPTTAQLALGELAINTTDGKLYLKKNVSGVETIVDVTGGGASISVSDTAPASPGNGSLWWNSNIGVLKIYYNDGTSSQWVDASHISASSITGVVSISNGGTGATTASAALTALGAYPATNPSGYITGSGSITGSAGSLTGFTNSAYANPISGPDNLTNNGLAYVTGMSLLGQTDGALYTQAYGSSWVHQIYGDYRTGQIALRGKNNGTWQAWRVALDASNYTSYAMPSGASATNSVDIRAPIFYDVDNTAYYLNPNGNSFLVGTTVITRNANSNDVFGGLELRENNLQGAATGAANEAPGLNFHWSNRGAARIYMNGSGNFVFAGQSDITNNRRDIIFASGYAATRVDAPIFYDSNNTAFYFDGASTTNINTLNGNGKQMFTTADSYLRMNEANGFTNGIWMSNSNFGGGSGILHLGSNGDQSVSRIRIIGGTYNGTNVIALDGSNGRITASDIRAPIFYDSDNTSYYLNAAGTDSVLNRINTYLAGKDVNTNWNTGFQNTPTQSYNFHGDVSSGGPAGSWWFYESMRHSNATNYWGTQIAWGWEDNATRLMQRNVTNGSFGGWVEYLNTSDRTYNGNLYMTGSIRSTSSDMRAPVFYDQDNTSYYINAAGTSYINALNIGPTAAGSSYLNINGYNAYGGTGFHGFLTVSNTYGSATNPNQYWRLNGAGGFEIVNSPYNAVLFTFTQGGDLTAAGNVTAYSDRKLKTNFEPIENALSKVLQLNGVTFTRVDKEDTTTRYAGLIAQDVEPVLPEAIQKNDTISYGEVLSVDYNGTIALLVEAIKEQQEQIKRLEEKVNSLG